MPKGTAVDKIYEAIKNLDVNNKEDSWNWTDEDIGTDMRIAWDKDMVKTAQVQFGRLLGLRND